MKPSEVHETAREKGTVTIMMRVKRSRLISDLLPWFIPPRDLRQQPEVLYIRSRNKDSGGNSGRDGLCVCWGAGGGVVEGG